MYITATAILQQEHGRLPAHWRAISFEEPEQPLGPNSTTGRNDQGQEDPPSAYESHSDPSSGMEGPHSEEVSLSNPSQDSNSSSLPKLR